MSKAKEATEFTATANRALLEESAVGECTRF